MNNFKNKDFWEYLGKLMQLSEVVIDRPKNSAHPKFPNFIYPVDYGFLRGTQSSDGNELDIFVGTAERKEINGVLCTVDLAKKDSEIKIIFACTEDELQKIYAIMNAQMKAIFISRS